MLKIMALVAFGGAALCGFLAAFLPDGRLQAAAIGLLGVGAFLLNLPG